MKKERAKLIMQILDQLYPETPIPLKHKKKNPFTLLVAVLLSARNTDKKVNEVTPGLFRRADTPQKMARFTPNQVRQLIRPIGLAPTKSKILERDLKKLFPQNKWRKLHLQIIFFGRQYCPARGHQPKKCHVCKAVAAPLKSR